MKPSITLQIGIDWSDEKHDYSLTDRPQGAREKGVVTHEPNALHGWIEQLRERFPTGRFEVCLELSKGPLIEVFREYEFIDVYPLNPITSQRFRGALYPSLSKDDPIDADLILDILLLHKKHLRPLERPDEQVRLLDHLNRDRRKAVERVHHTTRDITQEADIAEAVLKQGRP